MSEPNEKQWDPSEVNDIRETWYQKLKQSGKGEYLKTVYSKPTGTNHEKRWLVSNKEFKPLKDLLGQASDPITAKFYDDLKKQTDVEQFVMSPEIAVEVQRLAKDSIINPKNIADLMPKIKTPYSKVCVEMPMVDAVVDMRTPVTHEGISRINRVGAYITTMEEEDGVSFSFSPYFEFESGYVISSHILLIHKNNQCLDNFLHLKLANLDMIWNSFFHPSLVSVATENGLSPETFWEQMGNTPDLLYAMSVEAVEEIPTLFFAWLVLLNSKSGVTKTKVQARIPHPKLGKRERARRGRSAYTVVSLSDMEDVDSEGLLTEKHVVSAHKVRGHFKARRSGLYWWRPHVRGTGELKEREGYVVTS
jgi:hypothetical protein